MHSHWCVTVNDNSVTIFASLTKMQLRQVNENQNRFDINLGMTSSYEVTVSLRSEVNFGACATFNCITPFTKKFWPLTSCIFIVTSEGHACPGTDLWLHLHAYSSWHQKMSHPQINFKAVLIFDDLTQLHFCLAHKNSHRVIFDCHTQVILHLRGDKLLNYLIEKECWPNT